jgi:SlyX protein
MADARLDNLEEKYAHLERLVNELSEVVWRQQRELDGLKTQLKGVRERLDAEPGLVDAARQDVPPHY